MEEHWTEQASSSEHGNQKGVGINRNDLGHEHSDKQNTKLYNQVSYLLLIHSEH